MSTDEKDFETVSYEIPKDLTYMRKFFESFEGFGLEETVFDNEDNPYHKMIIDFQGEEYKGSSCMTLIYDGTYLVGVYTNNGFALVSEGLEEEDADWFVSVKEGLTDRNKLFIAWLDENGRFAEEEKIEEKIICGRCYDDTIDELFDSGCNEKPESLIGQPIGQYHCPDCGAMIMAGIPHPKVCKLCKERKHPGIDLQ